MIREEQPQDKDAVHKVHVCAFGGEVEADLVDKLRQNCGDLLSIVAMDQSKVVGHILFSPAVIESRERTIQGMSLAPVSVLPEYQLQGIGSELIRTGTAMLKDRQCPFIIVLGHPGYYPRFGFEPASRHAIHSEWRISDETFMILVLNKSEMQGISGVAKYRPEFSETA